MLSCVAGVERDGGLGEKGGLGGKGWGIGRKGRGVFSPPPHPDFAPAMQASSVLSHCLSQTRDSCTINSETLSFSFRCLSEYQPHRSWVTLWGARTPSKQNLVMFPPQDAHSELDILWFMVLYLVNYVLVLRSYLLRQFFVFSKVTNAQLEALRIENRHLRDSALNDQLTVSF